MDRILNELARRVGRGLAEQGLRLATAESCTGGWIAKVVTDIPGSSAWMERGFVTYSNEAKREMLGVAAATLETWGAVSGETVREMALGALAHSRAQVAVAVSGVAGPGGGSTDKPVGTVWLAWALPGRAVLIRRERFPGGRDEVRRRTVHTALAGLAGLLGRDG